MLYQLDFVDAYRNYQEYERIAVGFFTSFENARAYADEYMKADDFTAECCDVYIHSVRVDPDLGTAKQVADYDDPYPEYEWYSKGARCDISRRLALRRLGLNF